VRGELGDALLVLRQDARTSAPRTAEPLVNNPWAVT